MPKPNGHDDTLLQFPCDFKLKIVGKSNSSFEETALAIIYKHFPATPNTHIQQAYSKNKKYLSLSVTVHATSQLALDALYQDLSSTKEVMMVL